MTTICAMQPYLFPYLPYYQLAAAVDVFWVLDDVQFIRRGWMNRNRILLNGAPHLISFPVRHGHRGDLIRDKALAPDFPRALARILTTLRRAYAPAPRVDRLQALLAPLDGRADWPGFLDLALDTLRHSFASLGLATPIRLASTLSLPDGLRGQDRILALCHAAGARRYINPAGGRALYQGGAFAARGVELAFLDGRCPPYAQTGARAFHPGLSILDLVAHLDPGALSAQLASYSLHTPGESP